MTEQDEWERAFTGAVSGLRPTSETPAAGGGSLTGTALRPGSALSRALCLELFEAQLGSRHLDLAARWLRERGAGFYTIGSAGHEGNAAVAAAVRVTDPALLHYRSGAFYLTRACQADPWTGTLADRIGRGLRDVLLGLVAAAAEPISGGRHKVFGSAELAIIPQTSTIASHLPRAVGLAFALDRAGKLGRAPGCGQHRCLPHCFSYGGGYECWRGWDLPDWPDDAIVVCSFGDASVNHSTAAGAFNAAAYCAYQRLPLPLLLVCEDNGLGISVRTPPGWVAAAQSGRPGVQYFHADGADLAEVYDTALAAASFVRERRAPAFLHLSVTRLGGHAGSDAEAAYRSATEIAEAIARDPLTRTARLLIEAGAVQEPGAHDGRRGGRRAEAGDRRPGDRAAGATAPGRGGRPRRGRGGRGRADGGVRRQAAREGGAAHPGTGDQRHAVRRHGCPAADAGLRRGRGPQGRGVRSDQGAAAQVRRGTGVRLAARRAVGARPGPGCRAGRAAAGAGDPVPRLPAQRRRPDPGRGGHTAVLLAGAVPQPDGAADRRPGLSGGLRRSLPQRQRGRRAAGHPRADHRRAGPGRRRRRDAADLPGGGRDRRQRLRVPRTDRPVPHARRPLAGRRRLDGVLPGAAGLAGHPRAGRAGQSV